jgi:hypothetical protein
MIVEKCVCACFDLHELQFQHINISCIEVVTLIGHVCFYVSSKK